MTKIILFVIFLQVVFGILAKRKAQKQAEEAARNPDGAMGEGAFPEERPSLPSPVRRKTRWGGQSEDESEADWDEHHSEEIERSRAEGRKGIDKGKAKELGKDILSQLAKELGLEIPTSPKPAPRPAPAPPRPQPAAPAPSAKSKASAIGGKVSAIEAKQSSAERMAKAKGRHTEISRRSSEDYPDRKRQDAGESTPRRPPGYLAVTPSAPMAPRASASATARASLMDVKSLRNAFILKTILDKPLSLKPRGPAEI